MFTGAIRPLEGHSSRAMSDFQRIGICTVLFALLLSIGSAIGVVFFLNVPWQSSKSDAVPTHQLRSDKADFVLEIKRELGFDAEKRSKGKADITGRVSDMIASSNVPDEAGTALPNAQQNLSEPPRPKRANPTHRTGRHSRDARTRFESSCSSRYRTAVRQGP